MPRPLRDIRVATAQFEHRNNDKPYNLARIEDLTRRAVEKGAEIVSFHECSICGYTFLQHLGRGELAALAEPVPGGPSIRELERIARAYGVVVMAGLIEAGESGRFHNCYAAVGPDGFITKFRKLHTFITPHLSPGDSFNVIDLLGMQGRLLDLLRQQPARERADHHDARGGSDLHAPCHRLPPLDDAGSRNRRSRALGKPRCATRFACGKSSKAPRAAAGCLRWLPARAWENGVYAVFSNPIGLDDDYDQARTGHDPRPLWRGSGRKPGARR